MQSGSLIQDASCVDHTVTSCPAGSYLANKDTGANDATCPACNAYEYSSGYSHVSTNPLAYADQGYVTKSECENYRELSGLKGSTYEIADANKPAGCSVFYINNSPTSVSWNTDSGFNTCVGSDSKSKCVQKVFTAQPVHFGSPLASTDPKYVDKSACQAYATSIDKTFNEWNAGSGNFPQGCTLYNNGGNGNIYWNADTTDTADCTAFSCIQKTTSHSFTKCTFATNMCPAGEKLQPFTSTSDGSCSACPPDPFTASYVYKAAASTTGPCPSLLQPLIAKTQGQW